MPQHECKSIPILHIFGRMVRGGAEMRTLELMRHVDPERFRFEFCVLTGRTGELDDNIRALGGTVHYVRLGPFFWVRFLELLRRRRFGVVHSHVHLFSGFILFLAATVGVPVRLAHFRSTHDGHDATLRRRLQNRIMKYLLHHSATKIIAVSEAAMTSVWGPGWKSDSRCEVIYNGFDFARFTCDEPPSAVRMEFGLPANGRLFIHVGRMAPAKNHEKIIGIFQQIVRRDSEARLLLVGRGGNIIEDQIRQLCRQLEVVDRVVFAGERLDVPRLLMAADLLLFPSLWEGLPGAVLESCAAGTPILASDLPGIKEIERIVPDMVTCLPVATDNTEWARTAIDICMNRIPDRQLQNISSALLNTDFDIKRSIVKLSKAWNSKGIC